MNKKIFKIQDGLTLWNDLLYDRAFLRRSLTFTDSTYRHLKRRNEKFKWDLKNKNVKYF